VYSWNEARELSRETSIECDRNSPLSVSSVTFYQHFSWDFRSLLSRIRWLDAAKSEFKEVVSETKQAFCWGMLLWLNWRVHYYHFSCWKHSTTLIPSRMTVPWSGYSNLGRVTNSFRKNWNLAILLFYVFSNRTQKLKF